MFLFKEISSECLYPFGLVIKLDKHVFFSVVSNLWKGGI